MSGAAVNPTFDVEAGLPINANGEAQSQGRYKGKHPIAGLFHVAFKIVAILLFMFVGLTPFSDTTAQVILVLLLAADFWTVKNITGRVMVGLRWWNSVADDGSNIWHFESLPDLSSIDSFDSAFFWGALFLNMGAWIGMIILNGFSLSGIKWFPIIILALILGGANCYGFVRCRKDAGRVATTFVLDRLQDAARRNPEMVATAVTKASTAAFTQPGAAAAAAPAGSANYGFTPPNL